MNNEEALQDYLILVFAAGERSGITGVNKRYRLYQDKTGHSRHLEEQVPDGCNAD